MNTRTIQQKVHYLIIAALLALGLMTAAIANTQQSDISSGAAHQLEGMAGPTDDSGGG